MSHGLTVLIEQAAIAAIQEWRVVSFASIQCKLCLSPFEQFYASDAVTRLIFALEHLVLLATSRLEGQR